MLMKNYYLNYFLSLRILGDHGKVCFDAMQRKQRKCLERLVYS